MVGIRVSGLVEHLQADQRQFIGVLPHRCVTTSVCYHICVLPHLCVTTSVCYHICVCYHMELQIEVFLGYLMIEIYFQTIIG